MVSNAAFIRSASYNVAVRNIIMYLAKEKEHGFGEALRWSTVRLVTGGPGLVSSCFTPRVKDGVYCRAVRDEVLFPSSRFHIVVLQNSLGSFFFSFVQSSGVLHRHFASMLLSSKCDEITGGNPAAEGIPDPGCGSSLAEVLLVRLGKGLGRRCLQYHGLAKQLLFTLAGQTDVHPGSWCPGHGLWADEKRLQQLPVLGRASRAWTATLLPCCPAPWLSNPRLGRRAVRCAPPPPKFWCVFFKDRVFRLLMDANFRWSRFAADVLSFCYQHMSPLN